MDAREARLASPICLQLAVLRFQFTHSQWYLTGDQVTVFSECLLRDSLTNPQLHLNHLHSWYMWRWTVTSESRFPIPGLNFGKFLHNILLVINHP